MTDERFARQSSAAAKIVLACASHAYPQADCPSKPIRFTVSFPPGGGTAIVSRLVTGKLADVLGWRFIPDNRAGAGVKVE